MQYSQCSVSQQSPSSTCLRGCRDVFYEMVKVWLKKLIPVPPEAYLSARVTGTAREADRERRVGGRKRRVTHSSEVRDGSNEVVGCWVSSTWDGHGEASVALGDGDVAAVDQYWD